MKNLYLYISNNEDFFLGTLSLSYVKGKEVFSFEFSDEYLKDNKNLLVDPLLSLYKGKQYNFKFINDMTPDRFGSLLIDKEEQINAIKENRPPKKLTIYDYLTRVNDLSRMGAIRIKEEIDGSFINDTKDAIPPYIYLRDIEYASIKLEEDPDIDNDLYRRLLLPGSSLGGARPKASVYIDEDVYLAKFPSRNDSYDVELWEYVVLNIAKKCDIDVPDIKLDKYSSFGHTLLIKRFDRDKNKRIHYISGVTALGTEDGNSSKYSYLDLVNFINSHCINIENNLKQLYRRMVFNFLINNTDNHLRNHAFISTNDGLTISSLFDVNPSFSQSVFELPFGLGESKEGLINISKHFYLDEEQANKIYDSTKNIIIDSVLKYITKYPEIKKQADILLKIIGRR